MKTGTDKAAAQSVLPATQVYDDQMAAMQAVIDAAARGVRFGKSRLVQNGRIMVGAHGVKKSVAQFRQRQEHKRWMRERARVQRIAA